MVFEQIMSYIYIYIHNGFFFDAGDEMGDGCRFHINIINLPGCFLEYVREFGSPLGFWTSVCLHDSTS